MVTFYCVKVEDESKVIKGAGYTFLIVGFICILAKKVFGNNDKFNFVGPIPWLLGFIIFICALVTLILKETL